MKGTSALLAACILSSCSTLKQGTPSSPLPHTIASQIHDLLLQDPESRSLYTVLKETEILLEKYFPKSTIKVDVHIQKQKTSNGIGYVCIGAQIDDTSHTFFLSAKKINEEKISAKEIVQKLIWDMRETFRNYLEARMSIMPLGQGVSFEQNLKDFLSQESEALAKHGLIFTGKITLSGNILRLYFEDTCHGGDFDYTFIVEQNPYIAGGQE